MNTDRLAEIRRLTDAAAKLVEDAGKLKLDGSMGNPDAVLQIGTMSLDLARVQIELAQLHVAMGDWPIRDEPL